ncbi:SAICAR synthase-like protein [Trametopsis cervina]|nr:SAICAR synthase-like protein [Trametopsis cervina]
MSGKEDTANHAFQSLANQVGGHPGVKTSKNGELVMKPALKAEIEFYQQVRANDVLKELRPFVPEFYGTLRLEGQVDHEKSVGGSIVLKEGSADQVKETEKDSIVLENLSHKFLKPNIMDIKLGTVLFDRNASEEKRARMEKTARETTSFETGVRLTGFQVYDIFENIPYNTPKSYGKSIKPSDLPDGIARFFPVAEDGSTPEPPAGTGLPPELLVPVLEGLRSDITEIRQALAEIPLRMVGASLLIAYEADWDRSLEAFDYWHSVDTSDDEDEDEEDSDEEERPGQPYVVKLIDFAHTYLTPGEGPDESVLKGLDTVIKLINGRLEQVRPLLDALRMEEDEQDEDDANDEQDEDDANDES